ncbi:MAG TPA: NCS2 family permease [Candidatus Polarisedimenticolaceae bacterium]|nr:NCS2 family permease [Candidatus Polarisedimenticolaceae bacterium]
MGKSSAILERLFALRRSGTDVRTEVLAGLTTFLTMAYILFVQPAVLSGALFGTPTGMDFGAVAAATAISAAVASAVMALYARYPIAQAPGMGENFFFVLTAIPAAAAAGHPEPWRAALGMVFLSGVLFLTLSFFGVRERILDALSPSLRGAIAAGIGLFIAFIGLQNTGVIVRDPGSAVRLNPSLLSPDLLVFGVGLVTAVGLHARRLRGALVAGIAAALATSLALRAGAALLPALSGCEAMRTSMLLTRFAPSARMVSLPPSLTPTFLKMDVAAALSPALLPLMLVFLFMVLFDTVGTLVGVSQRAGMLVDGKLPRARQALASDAIGTMAGAALGTSTVTSYIESAAGVAQGGRTGLTALTVAFLFLGSLFFTPLVAMVGSYPPVTAPALVLVGALMMGASREIAWEDPTEAVPAFAVLAGIPLTYSIADGLALGFLAYPAIKLLAGRGREVPALLHVLGVVLALYLVLVRGGVLG